MTLMLEALCSHAEYYAPVKLIFLNTTRSDTLTRTKTVIWIQILRIFSKPNQKTQKQDFLSLKYEGYNADNVSKKTNNLTKKR